MGDDSGSHLGLLYLYSCTTKRIFDLVDIRLYAMENLELRAMKHLTFSLADKGARPLASRKNFLVRCSAFDLFI